MAYEHILVDREGRRRGLITMNRPEKRNALSKEHMTELIGVFRDIGERREDRVVILAGRGPAFFACHDLGK